MRPVALRFQAIMPLYGCPFCRELVPEEELPLEGRSCAVCGVPLLPIERLPPSYETRAAEAARIEATPPEHRTLPWTYLGRARGLLVLLALAGLAAFFAPWILMDRPDAYVIRGFDLARLRAGWFWGGAVGWFILIPLVVSRRTIAQMRGVRAIVALFSSLTLGEVLMIVLFAPQGTRLVPVVYSFGWGLYASALVSVAATITALFFGGKVDDIQIPPGVDSKDPLGRPLSESSDGQMLH